MQLRQPLARRWAVLPTGRVLARRNEDEYPEDGITVFKDVDKRIYEGILKTERV